MLVLLGILTLLVCFYTVVSWVEECWSAATRNVLPVRRYTILCLPNDVLFCLGSFLGTRDDLRLLTTGHFLYRTGRSRYCQLKQDKMRTQTELMNKWLNEHKRGDFKTLWPNEVWSLPHRIACAPLMFFPPHRVARTCRPWVASNPLDQTTLLNRCALSEWVLSFHNRVNTQLGKPS